jgi:hypothetical protein
MPTPPQAPPVAEMQACAECCADWLRTEGFAGSAAPDGATGSDLLVAVDMQRLAASALAQVVFDVYTWLWLDALPALDGRRDHEREQVAQRPPDDALRAPAVDAELSLGNREHELADRVRRINASIRNLAGEIDTVSQRQASRARTKGAETGLRLLVAYARWSELGETVRRIVEPSGSRFGGLSAPHTMQEWMACRLQLEVALHGAGATDPQISALLPGGSDAGEVYRRRSRAATRE